MRHPRVPRAIEYVLAIAIETLVAEMAVGVDQATARAAGLCRGAQLDAREETLHLAERALRAARAVGRPGRLASRLPGLAGQREQRPQLLALARDGGPGPDRDQAQRLEQRAE